MPKYLIETEDGSKYEVETGEPEKSVGGFASNLATGVGEQAKGLAQAVAHPINTARGLHAVTAGVLNQLAPENATKDPQARAQQDAAWQALKDSYAKRYSGGIADALYQDPAGVAADLSTVFGAAAGVAGAGAKVAGVSGAARTASTLGKVSDVAGTASTVTNPLTVPTKALGKTLKGTDVVRRKVADKLYEKALKVPPTMTLDKAEQAAKFGVKNFVPIGKSGLKKIKSALKPLGEEKRAAVAAMEASGQRITRRDPIRKLSAKTPSGGPSLIERTRTVDWFPKAAQTRAAIARYRRQHPVDISPETADSEIVAHNLSEGKYYRARPIDDPVQAMSAEVEATLTGGLREGLRDISQNVPGAENYPRVMEEMSQWKNLQKAMDPRVRAEESAFIPYMGMGGGASMALPTAPTGMLGIARGLWQSVPSASSRLTLGIAPNKPWWELLGIPGPVQGALPAVPAASLATRFPRWQE